MNARRDVDVRPFTAEVAVELIGAGPGHVDDGLVAVSEENEKTLVLKHLADRFTPLHHPLEREIRSVS
jgi:hypothetical protein